MVAEILQAGRSLRTIAKELDRAPSTINREVRRNRDPRTGKYRPFHASGERTCGGRAPCRARSGATRS
ncbi:helix-turn-helix domain-containing protein [Actinomadura namibiensis]|uniref:helix-turn-helix domain-containing protein n=1 Tax=Actinomadura kijaniata TaxID=46161 RepID=UPI003620504B